MISCHQQQILDTYIQVETPEGIELHAEPAGVVPRALAYVIDLFIRGVFLIIIGVVLFKFDAAGEGLYWIFFFLVEWWYPILFEVYRNGQTPGKLCMNIRVVNEDFSPIRFSASLCRNLLRVADFFPFFYLVGISSLLITKNSQRLGDLAAKTLVIQAPSKQKQQYNLALTKDIQTIAPHYRLDAPLRHAFVDFAVNRGKLTPSRQEEIAEILSPVIQSHSTTPLEYARGVGKWLLGNSENSNSMPDSAKLMKQIEFEKKYSEFWHEFEKALNNKKDKSINNAEFPNQYRRICQHLALAKSRQYTLDLIYRLNQLVQKGYEQLYGSHLAQRNIIWQFIFSDFPVTVQSNLVFVYIAAAVFFIPGILMFIACYYGTDTIYTIMDIQSVREMETMYDPDFARIGRERQSDTDLMMFGYYIENNIGISFASFASGLFFGVGSLFVLIYNGIFIGGIGGHLSSVGFAEPFFSFVSGHSSFELIAIVLSGAAGLKIGYAIIAPGPFSRLQSLQIASIDAIKIIYGSTLMLVIAAFVEAYWSSISSVPPLIKYSIGILFWALLVYYCLLSARRYGSK